MGVRVERRVRRHPYAQAHIPKQDSDKASKGEEPGNRRNHLRRRDFGEPCTALEAAVPANWARARAAVFVTTAARFHPPLFAVTKAVSFL